MAKLACECVLMCMCLLTVQIIQENRGGMLNGGSVGRASQATEVSLCIEGRISAGSCRTMKPQCTDGHPRENVYLHSHTCAYKI